MPHGAPANIRLRNLVHLDRRHHAAEEAALFDRILERDRVDHCREHAHVIGCDAIHVDRLLRHAAEEVAATHHNGDLAAERVNRRNLLRHFVNEHRINAEASPGGQGFA